MRNRIAVLVGGCLALLCTLFLTTASQATTTSVDLGMTGSTVAGFTAAQPGQELPVTFTMKNYSTTHSVSVAFYFTLSHATAAVADYTCPLISNHFNIFPDTPACEPGILGYGKSTRAAIMVTPTITSGTVTVRACAQDLDGYSDPISSNNCKTVSIPVS